MTSRRLIRKRLQLMSSALALAGALTIGYVAVEWQAATSYQHHASVQFDRELKERRIAPAPVPPSVAIPREGGLVGRIEIPRLQLSAMVVEGSSTSDLRHAVGHIPGTAFPGQAGNVALAAHRDTFFRPLRGVRPNDTIVVRTLTGAYNYRVVSTKVVSPKDVSVLKPAGHDELTLVTCFPFDYVGAAPKRFIVTAERFGG
jgi:sortase A